MKTMMIPEIELGEEGDLLVQRDEDEPVVARAARCFPWTHPDRFVVLRDAEDQEIATIENLVDLSPPSRAAIETWLERHTFIPRVQRVRSVREGNAAILFDFDTDRGQCRVKVREREDLRPLADGRTLVRDTDGVTYELPPWEELDEASQAELRLVL